MTFTIRDSFGGLIGQADDFDSANAIATHAAVSFGFTCIVYRDDCIAVLVREVK